MDAVLGSAVTSAGLTAEEVLGGGQQRPTPSVAVAVLVGGIDKVFGDHAAGHLEACDIGVEAAAHLGAVETTGGT